MSILSIIDDDKTYAGKLTKFFSIMLVFGLLLSMTSIIMSIVQYGRVVPVNRGGTGATSIDKARTSLRLGALSTLDLATEDVGGTGVTTVEDIPSIMHDLVVYDVIPVSHGGTNATNAANARQNFGIGDAATQTGFKYRVIEYIPINTSLSANSVAETTLASKSYSVSGHEIIHIYLVVNLNVTNPSSNDEILRIKSGSDVVQYYRREDIGVSDNDNEPTATCVLEWEEMGRGTITYSATLQTTSAVVELNTLETSYMLVEIYSNNGTYTYTPLTAYAGP